MAYNAEVADKIWLVSFMAILMTGVGISLWMVRLSFSRILVALDLNDQ